jgi:ABC-type oligopeptide transport system ATPase subunit
MSIVIYRDPNELKKNSWVKYLLHRIRNNQNNLVAVVGKTGSGKTYSALSVCELISQENGVSFTIDNVVFGLKELMQLINSGKLKKGSSVVFDEPQVSIGAREFQSEANRVFNFLLTTFRHRNLNLFFCTPFEDLLDKTARKLFHAKFLTMSIDRNNNTCRIKPVQTEYNSHVEKFYEKYLIVLSKKEGKNRMTKQKLKFWDVPKPSNKLINDYEAKKLLFTDALNQNIQHRLECYDQKQEEKYAVREDKPHDATLRKPLTPKQARALELMQEYGKRKKVAELMGIDVTSVYEHLKLAGKKGYNQENFRKNEIQVAK